MKLISLNTYCGKKMEALTRFLHQQQDTDVFCFQEVYHEAHGKDMVWTTDGSNFDQFNDIKKLLPNYNYYYRPHLSDWWGLAIFIKKSIPVIEEGEIYVYKYNGHNPEKEIHGDMAKNIQFLKIEHNGKPIAILNFHGLWNGKGKSDTEDRLTQSRNVIKFIKTVKDDYIFCGDFNLSPDTESFQMIPRELGCRDLIKEYGITSTRTSLYMKPNKFADYMFVSKGIEVTDFKVMPDVVSDHAPLLLQF